MKKEDLKKIIEMLDLEKEAGKSMTSRIKFLNSQIELEILREQSKWLRSEINDLEKLARKFIA